MYKRQSKKVTYLFIHMKKIKAQDTRQFKSGKTLGLWLAVHCFLMSWVKLKQRTRWKYYHKGNGDPELGQILFLALKGRNEKNWKKTVSKKPIWVYLPIMTSFKKYSLWSHSETLGVNTYLPAAFSRFVFLKFPYIAKPMALALLLSTPGVQHANYQSLPQLA